MHKFCDGLAVRNIIKPTAHERRLVVGTRQFHSRKGKTIGIYGRLLESPLRPQIAAEIGVAYSVAAVRKFTAEIDLERVSRIVVVPGSSKGPHPRERKDH